MPQRISESSLFFGLNQIERLFPSCFLMRRGIRIRIALGIFKNCSFLAGLFLLARNDFANADQFVLFS